MTNNTEQRKTSEQAPREAFERTVRNWRGSTEGIRAIAKYRRNCDEQSFVEAIWQAALAQREQTAPSLCTAEEAAFEVTPEDAEEWPSINDGMQEQIDNALDADRAKR
jgi:hypothetical protein